MAEKTKIVRTSDKIETGIFKIDRMVCLSNVESLEIKPVKTIDGRTQTKTKYTVKVKASHPIYEKIDFSFVFNPAKSRSENFKNAKEEIICMGTPPAGDIKDIVMGALSHESYAFQLSKKVTAWVHAEQNPNNGEYLLWHYKYYGKYSPRVEWKLPERCIKEDMWKKHKCKICSGSKCEYLMFTCKVCGNRTRKICPACKTPTCQTHSKCFNKHYILTKTGMYEGVCTGCGTKIPIGIKECPNCGRTGIKSF